jgi:hypothetical protein
MAIRTIADDTVAHAIGRAHRKDPNLPGTGGPAGNARLTAWTGVVLLLLFVAELVTLLDVRGLVSWHVAIGLLLIPPALVKTTSTGWRIVRYYLGSRPYRDAGPPPLPLRILGPLVAVSTLAVLVSGLVLVLIGRDASQRSVLNLSGPVLDATSIHKATFVIWALVTGAHTLARLVPALQLTVLSGSPHRPGVPGGVRRGAVLVTTMVVAAVGTVVMMGAVDLSSWHSRPHRSDRPPVTSVRNR